MKESTHSIYSTAPVNHVEKTIFSVCGIHSDSIGLEWITSKEKENMDQMIVKYLYPFANPLIKMLAMAVKTMDGESGYYDAGTFMKSDEDISKLTKKYGIQIPGYLKIRTMSPDAASKEKEMTKGSPLSHVVMKNGDPRVTPIGKILRKTSLDELPQIINIKKGEVSFVGPRLLSQSDWMYVQAHEDSEGISETMQKFGQGVKFGLTGPYGVYGRKMLNFHDRLRLESEYCDQANIFADWRFLARTPHVILFEHKGAK